MVLDNLEDNTNIHETPPNDTTISEQSHVTSSKHDEEESPFILHILFLLDELNKKVDSLNITSMLNDTIRKHCLKLFKLISERKYDECMDYVKSFCGDTQYQQEIFGYETIYANNYINNIKKDIKDYNNRLLTIVQIINENLNKIEKYGIKTINNLEKLFPNTEIVLSVEKLLKKNKQFEEQLIKQKISIDTTKDLQNLRECNINLQESENKLRIENSNLKKELLVAKNEVDNVTDVLKKKKVMIERQTKVISLLQKKVLNQPKDELPIQEIKTKIEVLDKLMGKVKNDEKSSNAINEEIRDLRRRLFDFNLLVQKKQ